MAFDNTIKPDTGFGGEVGGGSGTYLETFKFSVGGQLTTTDYDQADDQIIITPETPLTELAKITESMIVKKDGITSISVTNNSSKAYKIEVIYLKLLSMPEITIQDPLIQIFPTAGSQNKTWNLLNAGDTKTYQITFPKSDSYVSNREHEIKDDKGNVIYKLWANELITSTEFRDVLKVGMRYKEYTNDNDITGGNPYHFVSQEEYGEISFHPKQLNEIWVDTTYCKKLTFDLYDDFTYEGLTVYGNYKRVIGGESCGQHVISNYTPPSAPDMTTKGTKDVVITYEGLTASYTITVDPQYTFTLDVDFSHFSNKTFYDKHTLEITKITGKLNVYVKGSIYDTIAIENKDLYIYLNGTLLGVDTKLTYINEEAQTLRVVYQGNYDGDAVDVSKTHQFNVLPLGLKSFEIATYPNGYTEVDGEKIIPILENKKFRDVVENIKITITHNDDSTKTIATGFKVLLDGKSCYSEANITYAEFNGKELSVEYTDTQTNVTKTVVIGTLAVEEDTIVRFEITSPSATFAYGDKYTFKDTITGKYHMKSGLERDLNETTKSNLSISCEYIPNLVEGYVFDDTIEPKKFNTSYCYINNAQEYNRIFLLYKFNVTYF